VGLERAAATEIEGTAGGAGVDAESHNASTITTTPPSESSPTESPEQPRRETVNPDTVRPPRAVQAAYLRPLRRPATHGLPVCDLQLRSYSVRNLEFFADFCLRAAYYLGLPAFGPIPLPRIVERWTVPKGSFIHKKSQENFERKTLRRLIQIKDGEPETVEVWLAFVKKYAYYGIGMKANVWEFEKVGKLHPILRSLEGCICWMALMFE
jgi:small subunit ribosomal protein S10